MAEAPGDVERVVREALRVVRPDVGAIEGSTHLASELDMDSVQVMDLIMEIEDRLDISIPVATIGDVRTLDELCAGIRQLTGRT